MNTTTRVNAALWLALLLLLVVSGISYLSLQQLGRATGERVVSYGALDQIEKLRGALQDVETGSRGFVISGRAEFLEPYNQALPQIDALVAAVSRAVLHNSGQQAHLGELQPNIRDWLENIRETVAIRREGGFDQAIARVSSGAGKRRMDRSRAILSAMRAEEQRLLALREQDFEATLRNSGLVVLGGSVFAFALVTTSGVILNRQLAERNRLLEEKERASTELRELNRELEAFSYSVSHDLRAPLRHIDGFMGLLSKRAAATLDETSKRYVQTVTKAAQQMGRLIDDLLSFSRMSRHELHVGRVDMRALFEECRVAVLRDAGERKIEWKVGELPEITGDAAMLQMALENLLSNAVKYTRTREVAEITFDSTVEPGAAETRFRVMDNGVGFDMQYAGKLFGVFQRLHRPDEFEGTGIGLANVQRIIHRHRGRVWAESSPGAGAAFFFTLPNQTTA